MRDSAVSGLADLGVLFRCKRSDDVLETRITAERVPKRLQLQISIAKHSWNVSRRGKLFKREILLA